MNAKLVAMVCGLLLSMVAALTAAQGEANYVKTVQNHAGGARLFLAPFSSTLYVDAKTTVYKADGEVGGWQNVQTGQWIKFEGHSTTGGYQATTIWILPSAR